MADADGLTSFNPTQNIWKVTRQLKKEQSSLYNCVASVLSDASFVSEVRALYPQVPLLANLRCGLWYTRQVDGTCYFKSTDGHNGNWSFSSTRLNWHVCEIAAKQGGVIVVDATRKGKRFPDAMTKTIPIWAAVVNRAVARKRAEAAARSATAAAAAAAATAEPAAFKAAEGCKPGDAGTTSCAAARQVTAAEPHSGDARRDCGGGAAAAAAAVSAAVAPGGGAPVLDVAWVAWAATEGDTIISSCARVGSLSQWLHSPMAAALQEDAAGSSTTRPPPLQCANLCGGGGGEERLAGAAAAAAALLAAETDCCGGSCGEDLPRGMISPSADSELGSMELQEEMSFGDTAEVIGEMSPDGEPQPQQHQPRAPQLKEAVRTTCSCGDAALAPSVGVEGGGSTFLSEAVQGLSANGATASAPSAAVARQALSPFAVGDVGRAGAAPLAGVGGDAAEPTAVTQCAEPSDSVDLGAASASHVCCSPEEDWRRGGMFGCVVAPAVDRDAPTPSSPLLQGLCRGCGGRRCAGGNGHVPDQSVFYACQSDDDDDDEHNNGAGQAPGPAPASLRSERRQEGYLNDADGSGGSCSDTSGAAGLYGLMSTRTSFSSSSSSILLLSASCRSSCSSSDHSEGTLPGRGALDSRTGGGCRGGRGCMAAVDPSPPPPPRPRTFPRHHITTGWAAGAALPWSPQTKPRRCGALPPRPGSTGCGSADGGRLSSSSSACNGGSSCASSHGSSAGGECATTTVTTGAAAIEPRGGPGSCCAGDACACKGGGECWDVGLHLPLWISSNERVQIERRLDGWVEALLRVGADVEGLAKVLRKPLRPLWISQSSTIWVDQVAQPDQLPFTPLYLVSASQPHSYLRQAGCLAGPGGTGSDSDGDADADSSSGGGCATARRCHQRRKQKQNHEEKQQQHAWTYVYVPGAGDDEESWAVGLTPAVFWAHYTELLQAGPAGVHDAVRQVLQREAAALAERGTNSSIQAAAATHGSAAAAGALDAFAAATDRHHLLPAGCRGAAFGGWSGAGAGAGPGGLFFIGPTGIALGDLAAGAAPGVWSHVDAVLSCGLQQHPSLAGEPQWPRGELPPPQATKAKNNDARSLEGHAVTTQQVQQQQPEHSHQHRHHHQRHRPAPRYLHLPVQHFKYDRTALLQHLDGALEFMSYHLGRGHRVLIHDTNGMDTCVCVAVALLLACYGPCGAGEASAPAWVRPYRARGGGGGGAGADPAPVSEALISKEAVRQRLAFVSAFYPPARPTRGMLRQVFNHFVQGARGGCEVEVEEEEE